MSPSDTPIDQQTLGAVDLCEAALESVIVEKGLTAPRITPAHVDDQIVVEQYHHFPGTTTIVACLTLRNGFAVVGHSACASPENFNEEVGRDIARKNAREQIWALEGYALRNVLLSGFGGVARELARSAGTLQPG